MKLFLILVLVASSAFAQKITSDEFSKYYASMDAFDLMKRGLKLNLTNRSTDIGIFSKGDTGIRVQSGKVFVIDKNNQARAIDKKSVFSSAEKYCDIAVPADELLKARSDSEAVRLLGSEPMHVSFGNPSHRRIQFKGKPGTFEISNDAGQGSSSVYPSSQLKDSYGARAKTDFSLPLRADCCMPFSTTRSQLSCTNPTGSEFTISDLKQIFENSQIDIAFESDQLKPIERKAATEGNSSGVSGL